MNKITTFVKEAINELGKVTWPTRATVIRLTLGVLVVSIIFAIFVGVVDVGLTKGLQGLVALFKRADQNTSLQTSPITINPEDIQIETSTKE